MRRTLAILGLALGMGLPHIALAQAPSLLTWWYCPRAVGMAFGADGTLYAAQYANARMHHFTTGGVELGSWGVHGQTLDCLTGPWGIAVDPRGRLLVTELGTSTREQSGFQVFTTEGVYLESWGRQSPSADPEPGTFNDVTGVAIGPNDEVYVLDQSAVQVFTLDGVWLRQWAARGMGLAIGPDGNVYVAATDDDRLQVFDPQGTLLREWGEHGTGPGQFDQPHAVALDRQGHVYVADTYNHRVQVFESDGTFLTQWGSYGFGVEEFYRPMAILVDGDGYVYVADTWNGRIKKFGPAPTPASTSSWGAVKVRYR